MKFTCEALSFALTIFLVFGNSMSQVQNTINQPLNQNNGVCLCQAPPFNFSDLLKLHDDGCDARIARKKEAIALEVAECAKKEALLEAKNKDIISGCEEISIAGQNICNLQTKAANLELQKCVSDCSRSPVYDRLVSIDKLVNLTSGYYYISKPTDAKMNWHMADLFCKSNGLELASIESQAENQAIVAELGRQEDQFWISGSDLGSENRFYWAGNGNLMAFRDFDVNEPSNSGNGEHCVLYWRNKPGVPFKWNDGGCMSQLRFICELEGL